GLQLAIAQKADAVARIAEHAGGDEGRGIDRLARLELAGIDEGLDLADIHRRVFRLEDVDEAALRQAAEERHLAAFEPVQAHAGAGRLAFLAPARLLALARTQAAAEPRALRVRARIVAD